MFLQCVRQHARYSCCWLAGSRTSLDSLSGVFDLEDVSVGAVGQKSVAQASKVSDLNLANLKTNRRRSLAGELVMKVQLLVGGYLPERALSYPEAILNGLLFSCEKELEMHADDWSGRRGAS